jgi:hypothetical protein
MDQYRRISGQGEARRRASNQRGRPSAMSSDTICQTDSPQGILRSLCRHTTLDCPPSDAVIHALCFSNDCNLSHTRPDCPPSDDFIHALYFTDDCNLSLELRKANASRFIDKYRDSTQSVWQLRAKDAKAAVDMISPVAVDEMAQIVLRRR